MRKLISSGSPFEEAAGYSRAVVQGDWCFVAGPTGYDYETMEMPESVEEQTRNAMATIEQTLKQAGFALSDVVRAQYYIIDAAAAGRVFAGCRRNSRRHPARGYHAGERSYPAGNAHRNRGHRLQGLIHPIQTY